MASGFQTWKDIIEILVVPIFLAIAALLWPGLQQASRRRAFTRLILRELRELSPHPEVSKQGMHWWEHQTKNFVHKRIFESVSENRDFILSLPSDLVYFVSQLWDAKESHNDTQWLHFLTELSSRKYDKKGEIVKIRDQWAAIIQQYQMRQSGQYDM